MVTAQKQRATRALDQTAYMRLDPVWDLVHTGIIEGHVACIANIEFVERAVPPSIGRIARHQGRGLADAAGPETRTGPVGYRLIEGNAADGQIGSGRILGQTAAQKGHHPGKGVFIGQTLLIASDRAIDFVACIFKCH